MHALSINNINFQFPSKWDDLNKSQLFDVIKLLLSGLSETEFKLKSFLKLLNLKVAIQKPAAHGGELLYQLKAKKNKPFFLSDQQLYELTKGLDFFTKEVKTELGVSVITPNSELTKNLVPFISHGFRKYYGPADRLFNLKFDEYLLCETNLSNYLKSQSEKDLNKLVATLYRLEDTEYNPEKHTYRGDRREPFNDHLINARALKFRKLSPVIKISVLLYYQGCQKFLEIQFPNAFNPPKKKKSGNNKLGFLGLIDALTEGDVTKTEMIRKSYLYDVMARLESAALQYIEFENNKPK
jgi:hypothetical protein